jgi:hypothetical protein
MKISCPYCNEKAIITSRNSIIPTSHDLFCHCINKNCQAVFVYKLSLSHTIHSPIKSTIQKAIEIIFALSETELKEIGIRRLES